MTQTQYESQFKNLNISLNQLAFVSEDYLTNKKDELNGAPSTFLREAAKKFFTNKWLVLAFAIFVVIALLAIIVPFASPYHFQVNVGQEILPTNSSQAAGQLIGRDLIYLPPRFPGLASGIDIRYLSQANFDFYNRIGLITKVFSTPNATVPLYHVEIDFYKYPALRGHNFILGTTSVGSDRWTDLWDSAAFSLKLAFASTFIQFLIGMLLGATSGYYAGRMFDTVLQRVVDIVSGLPTIIWWMIVAAMFSYQGFFPVLVAVTLVGWVGPCYITRMFVIAHKDSEYIKAADTYGASTARKILLHMLPNVTGRLAASFVQRIPYIIYAEASLAILGIGINVTSPGLGTMISNGRGTYLEHPIDIYAPIILIVFLVFSLQVIAIGIRDVLDPKVSTRSA